MAGHATRRRRVFIKHPQCEEVGSVGLYGSFQALILDADHGFECGDAGEFNADPPRHTPAVNLSGQVLTR